MAALDTNTHRSAENGASRRINIAIIVLLVLLLISTSALATRVIYISLFEDGSTVIVPGNLIGKEPEQSSRPREVSLIRLAQTQIVPLEQTQEPVEDSKLSLYQGKPGDNEVFQVQNMFPGNKEEKLYAVQVHHGEDIVLYFDVDVTQQTKELAKALQIRVTHRDSGTVIYDGTFADMKPDGYSLTLPKPENDQTIAYFKIEVSAPTSLGNEYQNAMLKANFKWYVEDEGGLLPPTGDSPDLFLWGGMMAISAALIIVLLFVRRRNKEEENAK